MNIFKLSGIIALAGLISFVAVRCDSMQKSRRQAWVDLPEQVKIDRAMNSSSNFLNDVWAEEQNEIVKGWKATVLEQRTFVTGVYQTKVMRDGAYDVFLVFTGKKLVKGDKVDVGVYKRRASKYASSDFVHFIK